MTPLLNTWLSHLKSINIHQPFRLAFIWFQFLWYSAPSRGFNYAPFLNTRKYTLRFESSIDILIYFLRASSPAKAMPASYHAADRYGFALNHSSSQPPPCMISISLSDFVEHKFLSLIIIKLILHTYICLLVILTVWAALSANIYAHCLKWFTDTVVSVLLVLSIFIYCLWRHAGPKPRHALLIVMEVRFDASHSPDGWLSGSSFALIIFDYRACRRFHATSHIYLPRHYRCYYVTQHMSQYIIRSGLF